MVRKFMRMQCLAALAVTVALSAPHAADHAAPGASGQAPDARAGNVYTPARHQRLYGDRDIVRRARRSGPVAGDPVVAVAAGYDHNLALTRDGRVYAWGANTDGQLGDGGKKSSAVPTPVSGLPARDPVAVIAAGASHSLALTRGGRVYAWGANRLGQLGDGLTADSAAPIAVRGLPPGDPVVAIVAGGLHNLALTRDGRVYAWGANTYGQLGPAGVGPYSAVPILVAGLARGGAVVALAAGIAHSAALTRDGRVEAWGDDSVGQLGLVENGSAPVTARGLPAGDPVAALVGGGLHNLALTRAGQLYAWGDDSAGQLGVVGQGYISSVPLPVTSFPIGDPGRVLAVAAGYSHSLALSRGGAVYAWGANDGGQLGDGGRTDSGIPVAVRGLPSRDPVVALAAGHHDSLALTRSGRVYAWGGDADGELGDGATRDSATPVLIRASW